MNDLSLNEMISMEQDRRKIEELVQDGTIDPDDLQHAPILQLSNDYVTGKPSEEHITGVMCGMCPFKCKTIAQYEEHLQEKHL